MVFEVTISNVESWIPSDGVFQIYIIFLKYHKGWVVQAQFDPSDNRGHQPKTDGNTKTTAGNKLVANKDQEKS